MTFDDLLDRFFMYDCEIFAHDSLFVFISYKTRERFVFHNAKPNDFQEFIDEYNPILVGYNNNGYDKYMLKFSLLGYTPEELKKANDYIISVGNGWEIDNSFVQLPTQIDLLNCIIPRKSLKELEGNLGLNITETTIPFDLPTKWNKQEYEEVLYYCTCDVEALFPIFEMLKTRFISKFIIAKIGKMDHEYALSLTDANLTAKLLGAERKEHDDPFKYVYPDVIDKSKIPHEVIEYFDDVIEHNDLEYQREGPTLQIDDCVIKLQLGGLHGAKPTSFIYDKGVDFKCN